jgi:hypothetical protein
MFGEAGAGGCGTLGQDEWNPAGDDDGDGIPNSEEDIVVIANTEVFNAWENSVIFRVDLVIYGASGLAAPTGIGLPVEIVLGLAVGGSALGIHRQAASDFLTEQFSEADAADRNVDGFTQILPSAAPQPDWFP